MHPGYGFLSEHAALARACDEAGLIFIGPPADAIERMGSKIGARDADAGGRRPGRSRRDADDQSDAGVHAAARRLGYPVLVKASAGGGGKGMRRVDATRTRSKPSARRGARRPRRSATARSTSSG